MQIFNESQAESLRALALYLPFLFQLELKGKNISLYLKIKM